MCISLQLVLVMGLGLWLALGAQPPRAVVAEVAVTGEVYADEEDVAGNVLSTVNATGAGPSSDGAQTVAVTKSEVIGEDRLELFECSSRFRDDTEPALSKGDDQESGFT